ncbi:MAG: hypothetical protein NTU43_03455 [Bacteroidetes bacterium]|nr:hypothetical protein [Bacteroidota bacterium]
MPLQSPVLFLIFNRPDKTKQVFEAIRQAQPAKLFVAADGPRVDKKNEKELCEQTRDVIKQVNWPCEVKTLYRTENLGCKIAVSSAINWFFENVEEGIILEDDCLPNQSFFSFCQDMLTHYRDDERIMHIGGSNFQDGRIRGDGSYYFSMYNHIWGWATWRRAWKYYDIEMSNYTSFNQGNKINTIFNLPKERKYWKKIFYKVKENKINTWDYQWTFSIWINNGLSILPNFNLIKNIGFDSDGTHTNGGGNIFSSMIAFEIENKLIHPKIIMKDSEADTFAFNHFFYPSINKIILNRLNKLIK